MRVMGAVLHVVTGQVVPVLVIMTSRTFLDRGKLGHQINAVIGNIIGPADVVTVIALAYIHDAPELPVQKNHRGTICLGVKIKMVHQPCAMASRNMVENRKKS